jgi:hypothetical protein
MDKFWSLAMKTERSIDIKYHGETISLGPILDPVVPIVAMEN